MPATSASVTQPIAHSPQQGGFFSSWASHSWTCAGAAATTVQNGLSVAVIESAKVGQSAFNWLYDTASFAVSIVAIEAERHEVKQKMAAAATYTADLGMQALTTASDKAVEVGSAAFAELQIQAGHAGQALLGGGQQLAGKAVVAAQAGLEVLADKALELGSAALAELQVQAGHAGQALLGGGQQLAGKAVVAAQAGLEVLADKALELGSAALAELQVQAGHAGQALLGGGQQLAGKAAVAAQAGLEVLADKALELGSAALAELQVQAGHAGQALLGGGLQLAGKAAVAAQNGWTAFSTIDAASSIDIDFEPSDLLQFENLYDNAYDKFNASLGTTPVADADNEPIAQESELFYSMASQEESELFYSMASQESESTEESCATLVASGADSLYCSVTYSYI